MSDVQFEQENFTQPQSYQPLPEEKGMIGFLIKKGWAKDVAQANYILIGIVVVVILATFLIIRSNNSSEPISPNIPVEIPGAEESLF